MRQQAQLITIISRMILLSLLMAVNGCSTWFTGDFTAPKVHLVKVDIVKAKLIEQRFMLHFRIENPNDFSLPIRGLSYNVSLNNIKLAEGQTSTWFTVPAHGRETFKVPVNTNLWRHLKRVVKMLERPDQPIRYQLSGEVETGLMFGKSVHVQREGEIIPGNYIPE